MYVNNIEPEMFLPPRSESFNHNATRTTSSRSRSNNVNNNIVPVYTFGFKYFVEDLLSISDLQNFCTISFILWLSVDFQASLVGGQFKRSKTEGKSYLSKML